VKRVLFGNKPYLVPYESRYGLGIWGVCLKANAERLGVPTPSQCMIFKWVITSPKAKVEPSTLKI
jgi:hypothetical protein